MWAQSILPEDSPSHVVIYDFHDNTFVVLAQLPTTIPTANKKPALFRHKPGRIPVLEAIAIARHLGEKEQGSAPAVMA